MERLPDEARNLANRDVLHFLERQAKPAKPAYAAIDIDEYELHTHPDLIERLAEAGTGLDAPMVAVYGVPVFAASKPRDLCRRIRHVYLDLPSSHEPAFPCCSRAVDV